MTSERSGLENPGFVRALGLTDEDMPVFSAIFAEALSKFGMDGSSVLADLVDGKSVGEALAVPPGSVDLLYARAHHWFGIGRYDRSESLFRTLCVLDGNRCDFWIGYGICLKIRGQHQAAVAALRIAAEKDLRSAIPYYHLLELSMRRSEWEQAQVWLAKFDERASAETPPAITTDVARYRTALALRASAATDRSAR